MSIRERFLGQVRPDGSATAVTLVAATANITKVVASVYVNNQGAADEFYMYHNSGTASATATMALFFKEAAAATATVQLKNYIVVEGSAGALLVRSGLPDKITFTAYGMEITNTPYNV